jgi:ABC-type antimicrobial peptide transport system permease subunit
VGLYGITTYAVARRTHEIGIRMALGADRSRIVRMVSKDVAVLALLGLTFGVPLTLILEKMAANLLFGIRAADPSVLLFVTGTLACVAALAALLPSRRAASVDPNSALRLE